MSLKSRSFPGFRAFPTRLSIVSSRIDIYCPIMYFNRTEVPRARKCQGGFRPGLLEFRASSFHTSSEVQCYCYIYIIWIYPSVGSGHCCKPWTGYLLILCASNAETGRRREKLSLVDRPVRYCRLAARSLRNAGTQGSILSLGSSVHYPRAPPTCSFSFSRDRHVYIIYIYKYLYIYIHTYLYRLTAPYTIRVYECTLVLGIPTRYLRRSRRPRNRRGFAPEDLSCIAIGTRMTKRAYRIGRP